jgi:hypothetical protein
MSTPSILLLVGWGLLFLFFLMKTFPKLWAGSGKQVE